MPSDKPATSLLPWLLLFLSAITGLVDAVSVLGLGKVFTANMTGNIVFLGFAAAGTPGFDAPPFIVALAAFLMGAVAAGRIGTHHAMATLRRRLLTAATIETALLLVAGAMAIGFDIETQSPRASLYAIIALTALAMGSRNASIRQLKVPDLTTTVLTLTLTGLAADSKLAGGQNPNWGRRIASVASILIGAFIGAILVTHTGLAIPLFAAGALVLASTLICSLHPSTRQIFQA